MTDTDTFRARLGENPDGVYLDNLLDPEFEILREHFFGPQMLLNRAHVVMLAEVGLLADDDAGRILSVFDDVEETGVPESVTGADFEGVHFYVESRLIDELGDELGGVLQTGRSRTDVYDAACRLVARERILDVVEAHAALRAAVLDRAAETTDVVTTGYTHSQPAQPMTLSHYLLAFDHALERDFRRLKAAFENANQNPLGAAVLGGTGFDVDRERLSELCGFSSLCHNTYDATATMDFAPEAMNGLALLMATVSRVARDLIDWSTYEYGYLELSDAYASVSSMMPQKKNPTPWRRSGRPPATPSARRRRRSPTSRGRRTATSAKSRSTSSCRCSNGPTKPLACSDCSGASSTRWPSTRNECSRTPNGTSVR